MVASNWILPLVLSRVLRSIPKHIKHLNIKGNGFQLNSESELARFFKCNLPDDIEMVKVNEKLHDVNLVRTYAKVQGRGKINFWRRSLDKLND